MNKLISGHRPHFIAGLIIISLFFLSSSYLPRVEPKKRTERKEQPPTPETPILSPAIFGIRTVVIDAGHGGKDPGCIGTKYKEKDAALAIALKLGKYIEERMPDVRVIYTRKTDIFLDLDARAAIANKNKADLFICIHCNASEKKEAFGSETYVMGLHKSTANLSVAKRENAAILLEKNYQKRYDGFNPNSETGYILLTMQQNAYLKQSLNFASKIQKQLKEKAGRYDKGVQQAGFLVLWKTAMPSVLIETEFLTNPESEKLLSSEKGQDNFARSIFNAFRQYKDEVEGKLAKYDDDIENTTPFMPQKDTAHKQTAEEKKDSVAIKKEPVVEKDNSGKAIINDSSLTTKYQTIQMPVKQDSQLQVSEPIRKDSIRIPAKDTSAIRKEDPIVPVGSYVVYKVQVLSSSQRIPLLSDKFRGLKNIGEYEDGGMYKYTSGEFRTIDEAMKHRTEIQVNGHKDCFVVKFKDGKRLKN